MKLLDLWLRLQRGTDGGRLGEDVPKDLIESFPDFMLHMGVDYMAGMWVLVDPHRFREWAVSVHRWSQEEIDALDPYILCFTLQ